MPGVARLSVDNAVWGELRVARVVDSVEGLRTYEAVTRQQIDLVAAQFLHMLTPHAGGRLGQHLDRCSVSEATAALEDGSGQGI